MLRKILQWLGLSCCHRHLSQPFAATVITGSRSSDWDTVGGSGGHYVVCQDCGKKFSYDWSAMRIVG